MTKRILATLLAALMLAGFAGCTSSTGERSGENGYNQPQPVPGTASDLDFFH